MKIAIIGAGFTGLSAGLRLVKLRHTVTIFEKEASPGGLAIGFKDNSWKWKLEKHYHHLFVSDWAIRNLAKEVGHIIEFRRPSTCVFLKNKRYQLDSAVSLLRFRQLSPVSRIRTGAVLFFLKINPFWKLLEGISASSFLKKTMGRESWKILWEPLFESKFGEYKDKIPASWFWARIKKRSSSLGYPKEGFGSLAKRIAMVIKKSGGKFFYSTGVTEIEQKGNKIYLKTDNEHEFIFDKVISTLPFPIFLKITKGLPAKYRESLAPLNGIGAVNLLLILKRQFFGSGTYWLNINENGFPFLGVVEHTNFIDPSFYGGNRIIYIGNYKPSTHTYFLKNEKELLDEFFPYLKKINPMFKKSWVRKAFVFKAPFAQPIIPLNYSKIIPPLTTPIKGLYLATIQQVYPWDRGTNYAVELGERVAALIS